MPVYTAKFLCVITRKDYNGILGLVITRKDYNGILGLLQTMRGKQR